MPGRKFVLGLMSGTSADGLSIAAVTVNPFRVVHYATYPYSTALSARIIGARHLKARELSELNFELGRFYARAVRKFCAAFGIRHRDVTVIGSHGQTVCHHPNDAVPHTLQIGEASFIAEETGIPVMCDFRPMDMAAGGEGAPLIPFLDKYLFGNGPVRLLQNIGGIGNISVAGRGVKPLGFDNGPGNCLMDIAITEYSGGRMRFDRNGRLAASGSPDRDKVENFLKAPFFSRRPPKSLDRDEFGAAFIKRHFGRVSKANIADVMATLNLFTAESIALSVRRFIAPKYKAQEMLVNGGGALNPVLMFNLQKALGSIRVRSIADYGIHELAKEPACFALMGYLAYKGKSNHCPQATGARGERILGKLVQPCGPRE